MRPNPEQGSSARSGLTPHGSHQAPASRLELVWGAIRSQPPPIGKFADRTRTPTARSQCPDHRPGHSSGRGHDSESFDSVGTDLAQWANMQEARNSSVKAYRNGRY